MIMNEMQATVERTDAVQEPPEPVVPPTTDGGNARRHAVFHLLKVAKLDRITDDAVAITAKANGSLDNGRESAQKRLVGLLVDD